MSLDINTTIERPNNEISNLKQEVETKNAPNIEAKFELLSDANMPNGINRYRIVKKTINWKQISWTDIMWNFFECKSWNIDFKLVNWSKIDDYKNWSTENSNTAIIMPLPFVATNWKTEWITIINGIKSTSETKNYRGDNAIIWFKNWKSWIIKVNISNSNWNTEQKNQTLQNPQITAYNPSEQTLLNNILDPKNWYSVCQQMSIMDGWKKSCKFVGQSQQNQIEGWGRRYRFYVETYDWTMGVVDFKEDITINQAIIIMQQNGIKNAVYADIIAYNMYFWDKNGDFYTREEWNDWESSYEKISWTNTILPNKNVIIIKWK